MFRIFTLIALLAVFGGEAYMSVKAFAAITGYLYVSYVVSGGMELGKLLSAIYLHRKWYVLRLPTRGFYMVVIFSLALVASAEVLGFLFQQHETSMVEAKISSIRLRELEEKERLIRGKINSTEETLEGLPKNYVTMRLEKRKEFRLEDAREQLLQIAEEKAGIRAKQAEGRESTAPILATADYFGVPRKAATKWFLLFWVCILEPVSIGLAIAVSSLFPPRSRKENGKKKSEKVNPRKIKYPNARRLAEVAEERGLTNIRVADIMGVRQEQVRRFLSGEEEVSDEKLRFFLRRVKG